MSLLVFKFQFLPPFILFLLWQRNWRALLTLSAAGLVLLAASIGITGPAGFLKYIEYVLSFAPLRSGGEVFMSNWRGLIIIWSPIEEAVLNLVVVVVLCALSIWVAIPLRRGRSWSQFGSHQQNFVLLGLISASLLGYDTMPYSALMIIPPALLVAGDFVREPNAGRTPRLWALDLVLMVPSLAFMSGFLLTGSEDLSLLAGSQAMAIGLIGTLWWSAIRVRSRDPVGFAPLVWHGALAASSATAGNRSSQQGRRWGKSQRDGKNNGLRSFGGIKLPTT